MAEQRRAGAHRRRRFDIVVLGILAVVVAVITYVAARASSDERVARMWVTATVADDGSARIVEVIDYDFGTNSRHGIFREIPGLDADEPIEVSSPDAPDDVDVTAIPGFTADIRIGDPDETVTGLHRYVIEYTLDGLAPGGEFAWDAVGTGWDVPIEDVEVHVVAGTSLAATTCVHGRFASTERCAVEHVEPGHLVASVERLAAHEGVTVSAILQAPQPSTPALPELPAVASPTPSASPLGTAALAGALALLLALGGTRVLRRAGREHVPTVGVPTLSAPGEEARIDLEELAAHASPSPALPENLTPAQGGVLLADTVLSRHKAAWLLDQAVAGIVDLDDGERGSQKYPVLMRLERGPENVRYVLDTAFRGRERLTLGRYDEDFAAAWKKIGEELAAWRRTSDLWDAAAARRTTRVRIAGTLAGLAGLALAAIGGGFSASTDTAGLVLAAVGGAVAGAGFAAAVAGWELRVLTREGAGTWLRVESLRQFLAQSNSYSGPPVEVDPDLIGRYTAWALALGEAERWARLASRAAATASQAGTPLHTHRYYRYTTLAPAFVSSCSTTSVSPSSSSSGGGGGGGSVGGGGGGGGGGSW